MIIELRLSELEPLLWSDAGGCRTSTGTDTGTGTSPGTSPGTGNGGRGSAGRCSFELLSSAVDAALREKNAARAAEGRPALKSYFRDYAMLQEVTKSALRRLCGGITVAHTYADVSPYSVTSFFEVGVSLGLVSPADMVHFSQGAPQCK